MYDLDFTVSVCLGCGDGGDVCVSVEVSNEEYELLKACWREERDIEDFPGLGDLYERITEAAREENEDCMPFDSEEEIDYDDVSYLIEMPDEIVDEVEEEDGRDWVNYEDYPFAMEVTNGQILSMTEEFQQTVKERILSELQVTEAELADYLLYLRDSDEPFDERFERISDFEYDMLEEILGFNPERKDFAPEGIGYLSADCGWEARDLLEALGFALEENVDPGTHGHGADGVIFIPED